MEAIVRIRKGKRVVVSGILASTSFRLPDGLIIVDESFVIL